jgi:hypothetical protein
MLSMSTTTQYYNILSAVTDSSKRDIKKMLFFKRSWQQCSKFLMLLAISLQNSKRCLWPTALKIFNCCCRQRLKIVTFVADSI